MTAYNFARERAEAMDDDGWNPMAPTRSEAAADAAEDDRIAARNRRGETCHDCGYELLPGVSLGIHRQTCPAVERVLDKRPDIADTNTARLRTILDEQARWSA